MVDWVAALKIVLRLLVAWSPFFFLELQRLIGSRRKELDDGLNVFAWKLFV